MTIPPFNLDSESYLMGYVLGQYSPPARKKFVPASLGLYLNKGLDDCPYSFCYFGDGQKFMGHSSHIRQDAPIERAIIEAWYLYEVWPHYWQVCAKEDGEKHISEAGLQSEFIRRLGRFGEIVEEFKRREFSKALVYGEDIKKHESSRLFYPAKPAPPDVPRHAGLP